MAVENLTSLSGFWFDCVTSIPWSWLDFETYTVHSVVVVKVVTVVVVVVVWRDLSRAEG